MYYFLIDYVIVIIAGRNILVNAKNLPDVHFG